MNEINGIEEKVETCFYCSQLAEYFCDRVVTTYTGENTPPLEMWKACERPLCKDHKKTMIEPGEMKGIISIERGDERFEMDSAELCLEHANDSDWFYPIQKEEVS